MSIADQIPTTRLQYSIIAKKFEPVETKYTKPFLKGFIPIDWLSTATKLPGKSINLGLLIWWLAGLTKSNTVKLTGKALKTFNVSADACSDGLKRLETAGLITVRRAPGCRPTVSICEL